METVTDFIFLSSKITADNDCSHEIKRGLLLVIKAMTNLDKSVKSRDITLLTKVLLIKAVVFPLVMCGCESWTIKNIEHWRTDASNCGVEEDSWKTFGLQGDQTSQSKGNQPWMFLEELMLKLNLHYFGHLMTRADSQKRSWCWERSKAKEWGGPQRVRWLDSMTTSMDMNLNSRR